LIEISNPTCATCDDLCDGLSWLGVNCDPASDRAFDGSAGGRASRCSVRVLPSEEDAQIAVHTRESIVSNEARKGYAAVSPVAGRNPWLIALIVSVAAFMEVLDTTIANVALAEALAEHVPNKAKAEPQIALELFSEFEFAGTVSEKADQCVVAEGGLEPGGRFVPGIPA
jgi:hypothetical protein